MIVTSSIFEAFLKCPTKCWLQAAGEPSAGNTYAELVTRQNDIYREAGIERLIAAYPIADVVRSPAIEMSDTTTWRLATNLVVQAAVPIGVLESKLHVIERVPSQDDDKYIPARLAFPNKLGNDTKLLLGFDVFVLECSLQCNIAIGKIIHGDTSSTVKVKLSAFTTEVRKRIAKISALLSGPAAPDLILNRHCPECAYRDRCRQKAIETDDLSLLSGMSERERATHRSKGIFTVTQLSYTFRPRRTPRRAVNPGKPHHFALQALAIREGTVYIHGSPELPECKTRIYLDIEGLPDRDFYYLIGTLVVGDEHEAFYSFWADAVTEEQTIFLQFADIVASHPDCRVFHYGEYDVAAIKRVANHLAEDKAQRLNGILDRSVNVLSLVYPHVYFPVYSNGLKDIRVHLGPDFTSQDATALDSIIWRLQWEKAPSSELRTRLFDYNRNDCIALKRLTEFIIHRTAAGLGTIDNGLKVSRTEDMKLARPHWQLFAAKRYFLDDLQVVNKSAYFDYQREKVFVRTHPAFRSINKHSRKRRPIGPKPNKIVALEAQRCPNCRSRHLERSGESSHDVVDLKFSRMGVRRCVTRSVSWRYRCRKCGHHFRSEIRQSNPQRYGHGLASWCVYQNNVAGLNLGKVRRGLADVFGLRVGSEVLERSRDRLATIYEPLSTAILQAVLASPVIHIDETTVRMRKTHGYVWVLATLDKVYYLHRPTREAEFLRELLAPFHGVLVSDFYTGYDSLPCEQQKCLIHLIREIDDDLLRNPLDEELRALTQQLGALLRSIIGTIDQFGLRRRHLNKHRKEAERFLTFANGPFASEVASKYGKRFEKYGSRMFTFLKHRGVPWNNNNAEHAIKRFVKYRRDTDGRYTERSLKTYLVLATVFETCEFNNVNVLKFLLSKETTLDGLLRMAGRRTSSRRRVDSEDQLVQSPGATVP